MGSTIFEEERESTMKLRSNSIRSLILAVGVIAALGACGNSANDAGSVDAPTTKTSSAAPGPGRDRALPAAQPGRVDPQATRASHAALHLAPDLMIDRRE